MRAIDGGKPIPVLFRRARAGAGRDGRVAVGNGRPALQRKRMEQAFGRTGV